MLKLNFNQINIDIIYIVYHLNQSRTFSSLIEKSKVFKILEHLS